MTTFLLVGEMKPGQLGEFCYRALNDIGVNVKAFDMGGYPFAEWRASSIPLLPDISHWIERRWANYVLPQRVRQTQPDKILILGGRQLSVGAIRKIKENSSARLASWNPDSPWEPHNSSQALLETIPAYDMHFTWGNFLKPQFEAAGAQRIQYLPFAYDSKLHRPSLKKVKQNIVFAGTWEAPREALLNHVPEQHLELWGNHWHRLGAGSPLKECVQGVAEGDRLSRVLSGAQIALNFVRSQNASAHNMRTYEAPACGAFMLSSQTEEQLNLLTAGTEADYFSDGRELREKCDYYLARPDACENIAQAGYLKITNGNNTYQDRMRTVVNALDKL